MCSNCNRNKENGGSCDTSRSNGTGCFLFAEKNKNNIDYGKLFGIYKQSKRADRIHENNVNS